jgi:hypothetical protein
LQFNNLQGLLSRRAALGLVTAPAWLTLPACGDLPRLVADSVLPEAPPYPAYASKAAIEDQAQRLSDALQAHVVRWLDGQGPAEIPFDLMPPGLATDVKNLRLVKPEAITPTEQWLVRPAELMGPGDRLDFERLRGYYPDPHVTYAVPGIFVLPFGVRVVLSGEFPRARFFDVQVSPPFDPAFYYYGASFGAPASASSPLAGVALPKVHYKMPDGRDFYITCDATERLANFNGLHKARASEPTEPIPELIGPQQGWGRSLDIYEDGLSAIFQRVGKC